MATYAIRYHPADNEAWQHTVRQFAKVGYTVGRYLPTGYMMMAPAGRTAVEVIIDAQEIIGFGGGYADEVFEGGTCSLVRITDEWDLIPALRRGRETMVSLRSLERTVRDAREPFSAQR